MNWNCKCSACEDTRIEIEMWVHHIGFVLGAVFLVALILKLTGIIK